MNRNEENKSDIFKKIVLGQSSTKILYQDFLVTVFEDIKKLAPIHLLIIPNRFIKSVNDIQSTDKMLLGHMLYISKKIAHKHNIATDGYRLVINCNRNGGQEIPYLHIHLLGGRKLGKQV